MRRLLPVLLCVALVLSGCGSIDVTRLLDHEAPTRVPEITLSTLARPVPEFSGPATRLRIYEGDTAVGDVPDPAMANQLFWAAQDDSYLLTDEAQCGFDRKVEILDDKDTVLAQIMVASDGCRYATRADGAVMMVPEYVYYGMECALWNVQHSFTSRSFAYQPETDSDAVIEMRMQHEIPALLRQRYGYADGYFGQWELFGLEKEKDTVTVYAQLSYGLYTLTETSFTAVRQGHVALRLVYDWVDDNIWQLGSARFSDDSVEDSQIESAVRSVFPFEYTQRFMQGLKDTSALDDDVKLQAKEYLRQRGLGRLALED